MSEAIDGEDYSQVWRNRDEKPLNQIEELSRDKTRYFSNLEYENVSD